MAVEYKTPAQYKAYYTANPMQSEMSQLWIDIYAAIFGQSSAAAASINSKTITPGTNTIALGSNFTGGTIIGIFGINSSGNPSGIAGILVGTGAVFTNGTDYEKQMLSDAITNGQLNSANNAALAGRAGNTQYQMATNNITINLNIGHGFTAIHVLYVNGPASTT